MHDGMMELHLLFLFSGALRLLGLSDGRQKWCSCRRQEFPPPWYPVTFELPSSLEEWKQRPGGYWEHVETDM